MDLALRLMTGTRLLIPLDTPEVLLGREVLVGLGEAQDPALSRRHATLTRGPDGYVLRDLGSRNGTILNGNRLTAESPPQRVQVDDLIEVGGFRFTVVGEGAADDAVRLYAHTTMAAAAPGAPDRLRLVYDLSRLTLTDVPPAELGRRLVALLQHALPRARVGVALTGDALDQTPFAAEALQQKVLGDGRVLRQPPTGRSTAIALPLAPLPEPLGLLWVQAVAGLAEEEADFVLVAASLAGEALRRGQRRSKLSLPDEPGEIIGESDLVARARREVDLIAPYADLSVMLVGETGVGKELFARRLHTRSGRNGPQVNVNVAAIPSELMESELFGHVKGAFTGAFQARTGYFEVAQGGTLFLDEIGEMPTALQAKLLRVLQDRVMTRVGDPRPIDLDVRVVAATNVDILARVESGAFRRDLYYRLAGKEIRIPPLRERPGDVRVLAEVFRARMRLPSPIVGFEEAALALLERAPWPGNVRQLENTIRLAAIHAHADGATRIAAHHLDPRIIEAAQAAPATLAEELEQAERTVVLKALRLSQGNKREAARLLDWSINTLRDRIARWGLGDTP